MDEEVGFWLRSEQGRFERPLRRRLGKVQSVDHFVSAGRRTSTTQWKYVQRRPTRSPIFNETSQEVTNRSFSTKLAVWNRTLTTETDNREAYAWQMLSCCHLQNLQPVAQHPVKKLKVYPASRQYRLAIQWLHSNQLILKQTRQSRCVLRRLVESFWTAYLKLEKKSNSRTM